MMTDDGFVEMGSVHNSGWLIDYMDEVQGTGFIWSPQILNDQTVSSTCPGIDVSSQKDEINHENSCLKKRARTETCSGPGTKACREKIRRDKLNDRFLELCSILEPGRPPKTDKIIILGDATRLLNQLRLETKKLKETNEALQDTIKSLKVEKLEMREEKVRLKAEKEKLEQALKTMSMPSPFVPHPAFHASAAATFATTGKTIPYHLNYPPPMAMWQWMPPASLDTSQDHVLRPPVA
ncbi:Myc-type [Macleaya cordata]|uniref:Myc-type n=1 Tax=Macleaya cordata TaxID=56857 RepID=A0A200R4Y5_MACCD|nr:Myc-type [Macleaya cordata]